MNAKTFSIRRIFFDDADETRPLVFFPETAWWLGFDNNVPLVNPITGRSREYDIREELPAWSVMGHVTFTTGREWTYWQYDHYLTRVTWDGHTSWNDYLTWLAPIYGENGDTLMEVLKAWGDRQWTDLYVEHPEIYFYLSGELPQDELGEQAGIIRRPKIAFRRILEMDESAFEEWKTQDLEYLRQMHGAYASILEDLPNDLDDSLWLEASEQAIGSLNASLTPSIFTRGLSPSEMVIGQRPRKNIRMLFELVCSPARNRLSIGELPVSCRGPHRRKTGITHGLSFRVSARDKYSLFLASTRRAACPIDH